MNTTFHARTSILSIDDSKKFWRFLSKKRREYAFVEIIGVGGSSIEVEKDGLRSEDLESLDIPDECDNLFISSGSPYRSGLLLDDLEYFLIGGKRFPNPQYGWLSKIQLLIVPSDLSCPLLFEYSLNNTMDVFGRKYGFCNTIKIVYMDSMTSGFFNGGGEVVKPSNIELQKSIDNLWRRFELPVPGVDGFLEGSPPASFLKEAYFDPNACSWGWREFENMVRTAILESPVKTAWISSNANPGFLRSHPSMVEEARKLLSSVSEKGAYECYNVRYNTMTAMSWRDREKLRKRWKKPILHEVGKLVFKSGCEAELKILIQKEGYIFILEFGSMESVDEFSETDIYKAMDWEIAD